MEFMKVAETLLVVVIILIVIAPLTFVVLRAMSGVKLIPLSTDVPKIETVQDNEERDYFSSYAHYTDELPVKTGKGMKDVVWSEDYQSRVRNDQ